MQCGTVIKADLDRVAQASPGSKVRFRAVGIGEALQARSGGAFSTRKISPRSYGYDRRAPTMGSVER